MSEFHVVGQSVPRIDAVEKATGRAKYTADLHPPRPAPRPPNSVLDNAALRLSGTPLLPDFREPLARLVRDLVDG